MPIHHSIWRVGDPPSALATTRLATEQQLEEMVVSDSEILSSQWMMIGRQENTSHGGRLDLLAVAPDGSLVLIELKRDRTPRDIVAQAIDYAAWVEDLEADKIAQIYHRFSNGGTLEKAFERRFGSKLDEDNLNQSHQIVIVAAQLDNSTERIIRYLNGRGIAINVAFFQVFEHAGEQLLSRAWLVDPSEAQVNVASATESKGKKEPWNGEYYVSFGGERRSWADARQYGFISAGGGSWYSQTLKLLSPGDRIWVNIPKVGYVGVGLVRESVQTLNDFTLETPEGERPAAQVLTYGDDYLAQADDPDKVEQFVRVDWLSTIPEADAISEIGLFGNQNTVCQPRSPKWRHTVERLKARFPNWQGPPSKQAPSA